MHMDDAAQGLDLRVPWMNAAGSLGFAPDPRRPTFLDSLGAFVTNPISPRPRRASQPPRQLSFPGGVLLHTGRPNPGLNVAIKRYAAAWARASLPIIVHLFSSKPDELRKAVLRVEDLENVMAVEISLEADSSPELAMELVLATQGELPIIVQLPLYRALEMADKVSQAGAAAISLGPARGALPGPDGKFISGRLYGAAFFPPGLETVRQLSKANLPIIGSGGVETRSQGEVMLAAGAVAVQLDVGLWKTVGQ
ncbi:MAG TPA: hypothetical protein VI688_04655 [Anaerolineales bacterium]|nr:hypothetical protein [Anaerolineales bacterium]